MHHIFLESTILIHSYFRHLESSLELIQSEFESMEDYWQGKIMDERKFYEEQVQVSESQFKELEIRMKEYEDLLTMESVKNNESRARLDTIDEDRNMEEKVTEWEEEITHLNHTMEEMEVGYEQKLNELREKVCTMESKQNQCKCGVLSIKRRNLESFWMKVVKSDTGPLSLPSVVLVRDDRSRSVSGDSSRDDNRHDMFTQAPHMGETLGGVGSVESSVCGAYRAILADISREMTEVECEHGDCDPLVINSCLHSRMSHLTTRCYQLMYNLHQTKAQCENNITGNTTNNLFMQNNSTSLCLSCPGFCLNN